MAWLRHVVVTPPAADPITLSDVKEHCKTIGSLDDTALTAYLKASIGNIQDRCGVKLITQTVKLLGSCWGDLCRLPISPLISVASVKYLDENEAEQTFSNTNYDVIIGRTPSIVLKVGKTWPAHAARPDAIRVQGDFGFGNTGAAVPDAIKLAMYLLIGGWNENRESVGSNQLAAVPNGVDTLLADYGWPVG